MSRALFNPIPDWICTEGCLLLAVLRETREEPFEGPVAQFYRKPPLHHGPRRMWLVRLTPRTLSEKWHVPSDGSLQSWRTRSRMASDDICLAQELLGGKLPRPNSDSDRDAHRW